MLSDKEVQLIVGSNHEVFHDASHFSQKYYRETSNRTSNASIRSSNWKLKAFNALKGLEAVTDRIRVFKSFRKNNNSLINSLPCPCVKHCGVF